MEQIFFELLYNDAKFCNSLGQVILGSSKFENLLKDFLRNEGHPINENFTLGQLTQIANEKKHFSPNGYWLCEDLKKQRNYLSHRLYEIFEKDSQNNELPRLPSENLVPEDVEIFTEKVSQTATDFYDITNIIIECINMDKWKFINGKKIFL